MRSLLSASLILSLTLLAGRFAGFLREMELSAVFGISQAADFAVVMLTTPDLFVNLLLAGGLSVALIPEFVRLQGRDRTRVFFLVSGLVVALFGAIAALIIVRPSLLILAFAPGYASVPPSDYSYSFALAALAIPLAGLTGVTSALLNSEQKFFVAGAGTLVFNVVIILALHFFSKSGPDLMVLAIAIAIASALRYSSQLLACVPHLYTEAGQDVSTDFRKLSFRFIQALGASTLVLFIPVILRAIVSLNGAGNIAAYNFATKLVELPLGIAITAISAVAFPAFSRAIATGDLVAEEELFSKSLQRSMLLSLVIAIPCFFFSYPLVSVVFGRGQMTASNLQLVADLARLGFLTLPSIAVSSMASSLLNARGETARLLKITIAVTLLVPIIALPGVMVGDAKLSVLALPIFHLIYAVILARATRHPLFIGWTWMTKIFVRPLIASVMATALLGVVWLLLAKESALTGSVFAFGAMCLSLAFAGGLRRPSRVV